MFDSRGGFLSSGSFGAWISLGERMECFEARGGLEFVR